MPFRLEQPRASMREEVGETCIRRQRNDLELDQAGFDQREAGEAPSSLRSIAAFEQKDRLMGVGSEIEFAQHPHR